MSKGPSSSGVLYVGDLAFGLEEFGWIVSEGSWAFAEHRQPFVVLYDRWREANLPPGSIGTLSLWSGGQNAKHAVRLPYGSQPDCGRVWLEYLEAS